MENLSKQGDNWGAARSNKDGGSSKEPKKSPGVTSGMPRVSAGPSHAEYDNRVCSAVAKKPTKGSEKPDIMISKVVRKVSTEERFIKPTARALTPRSSRAGFLRFKVDLVCAKINQGEMREANIDVKIDVALVEVSKMIALAPKEISPVRRAIRRRFDGSLLLGKLPHTEDMTAGQSSPAVVRERAVICSEDGTSQTGSVGVQDLNAAEGMGSRASPAQSGVVSNDSLLSNVSASFETCGESQMDSDGTANLTDMDMELDRQSVVSVLDGGRIRQSDARDTGSSGSEATSRCASPTGGPQPTDAQRRKKRKRNAGSSPEERLARSAARTPGNVDEETDILKGILKKVEEAEDARSSMAHRMQGRVSGRIKANLKAIKDDVYLLLALGEDRKKNVGGNPAVSENAGRALLQMNKKLRDKSENLERELAATKAERSKLNKTITDLRKTSGLASFSRDVIESKKEGVPNDRSSVRRGPQTAGGSSQCREVGGVPIGEIAAAVAEVLGLKGKRPTMKERIALRTQAQVQEGESATDRAEDVLSVSEDSEVIEPATQETELWSQVVKRGKKGGQRTRPSDTPATAPSNRESRLLGPDKAKERQIRRKLPRGAASAAIRIFSEEPDASYVKAIETVKKNIRLEEVGIEALKVQPAFTGGLLMLIPGKEEGRAKAKTLAEKMRRFLPPSFKVDCPRRTATIRVSGIEPSVTRVELVTEVAKATSLEDRDIVIKQLSFRGLRGMALLQLPLQQAQEIADKGKIRVGWSSVGVRMLDKRPPICFKCWGKGHVRAKCTAVVDRSSRCFRCGLEGHMVGACLYTGCRVCGDDQPKHKPGDVGCRLAPGADCGVAPPLPQRVAGTTREGKAGNVTAEMEVVNEDDRRSSTERVNNNG